MFQRGIDEDLDSKVIAKKHCRENCKAHEFHKWLKDRNYKIVKDMDYTVEVLRTWFIRLEEELANGLDKTEISDMCLGEPLEMIANCIIDLEGRTGEKLKENKDENNLQKGDKFRGLTGNKYEVIASAYDEYDRVIYYFCKRLDTKIVQTTMVDNASILEIIN